MMQMDGRPIGEGLATTLWRNAEAVALESLHCPFVTGLAQGTLSKRTFQHYVAQDAFYLQFFARAYALAMSKCDPAHISRATFDKLATMLQGVHAELKLHDAYAISWGVDLDNIVPSPATLAYTNFLMEVAHDTRTGLAEVLCAMAPCARLYGFLGCQLANAFPGVNHAYSDWIRTYSTEKYMAIPIMKEEMLEEAANAPGTDLGRLQRLYTRAMQLEVDFFQAQPAVPPPRAIRSLVVDFDDTCTQEDTITLLFEGAARAAEKAQGPAAGEAARSTAKQLSSNYLAKYQALMQQLLPAASGNGMANGSGTHEAAATTAYDPQRLSSFLDKLSDFDASMIKPVEDSGILKGLSMNDISDVASRVHLRPGCHGVLDRALSCGLPTHVLSINWSSQLIIQALQLTSHPLKVGTPPALTPQPQPPSTSQLLCGDAPSTEAPGVNLLVANQLEVKSDLTTGRITTNITCARDKAWAFSHLCGPPGGGASVYVGDSTTDLAPLLQADFGIVVGNNSSLRKLCREFGVTLKPLITAPLSGTGPKGVLYEATSWSEIEVFLFGPNTYEAHPYKTQMQAVRSAWAAAAATQQITATAPAAHTPSQSDQLGTDVDVGRDAPFVPVVLTIAGSDSGGGAGIQADLKAMQACGVFGTSALAALTAQNTHGVHSVHVAPLDVLAAQVDCVMSDMGAHVVKTGMLPTPDAVKLVADKVRKYDVRKLVVDPVMVSTSGHELAGSAVAEAMTQHLLPLALLVTPNIPEASLLLDGREIKNEADMCSAARDLHAKLGCHAVLVKGGHLVGSGPGGASTPASAAPKGTILHEQTWPPHTGGWASGEGVVTDVLFDGKDLHVMRAPVIPCTNTHGTGCTLASAVSSFLARGQPLVSAVMQGRDYLQACLRHSTDLHIGTGVQRPFNHGWQLADWQHQGGHAPSASTHGLSSRWAHADVAKAMTLYAVTESRHNEKHGRSMEEAVAAAIAGGVTIVQIREKDIEGGTFLKRAHEALKVCRAANVPLIINDRIDIALALGPDVGVHIGQGDIPVHVARTLLGPGRMLGVSCKTEEQARKAIDGGADYLGVGAVYPTTTKDSRVIGTDGLAAVTAAAHPIPIVAIGGIKDHHITDVMATGAAGIAVVTAIFDQVDITKATHKLYEGIVKAKEQAKQ